MFCGENDLDVELTESCSESKAAAINVPQGRAVVEKKAPALQANQGVDNLTTLSKGQSQSKWTTYTAPAYIQYNDNNTFIYSSARTRSVIEKKIYSHQDRVFSGVHCSSTLEGKCRKF